MMLTETAIIPAGETWEVMDALYRFGAGVDHNDGDLLATAFSDDAVIDFRPCGRRLGLDFPLLTGGETILRFLRATAETQTTTHVVTNGRAQLDGPSARLRALVDATHLPKNDHSRRFRMMNWYEADLIKTANLWRMRHLVIKNAWFTGDTQVLLGR